MPENQTHEQPYRRQPGIYTKPSSDTRQTHTTPWQTRCHHLENELAVTGQMEQELLVCVDGLTLSDFLVQNCSRLLQKMCGKVLFLESYNKHRTMSLHAGWRTHLVVTSIIWPRAQLWCLSELTMQLVPIKWKEALKDCNPTSSSSGKHLWSSKKFVQGLHKAGRRIKVGLFWGLQALDKIPQERWGTQQATRYGGGGTSAPAFTSPLVSSSLSLALQSDFWSPRGQCQFLRN